MSEKLCSKEPVGVIVARFQVAWLHPGHIHLIAHVRERHEDVFIVLGTRMSVRTQRDPLTFEERMIMIKQSLPEQRFTMMPLLDHPFSNDAWSKNLDALIEKMFPDRSAILYGARDSFIPYYTTKKFPTQEVKPIFSDSGTLARQSLKFPHTADARAAIIYEMEHRPPFVYSTSDLAIVDEKNRRVLLIGKDSHDGKLSFIGGHAEKSDASALDVAKREGREEVLGIGIGTVDYVDSITINDPRYKNTSDGVMTAFYVAPYLGGDPSPGDDANSVHWVLFDELISSLVPWHQPLGNLLLRRLGLS